MPIFKENPYIGTIGKGLSDNDLSILQKLLKEEQDLLKTYPVRGKAVKLKLDQYKKKLWAINIEISKRNPPMIFVEPEAKVIAKTVMHTPEGESVEGIQSVLTSKTGRKSVFDESGKLIQTMYKPESMNKNILIYGGVAGAVLVAFLLLKKKKKRKK